MILVTGATGFVGANLASWLIMNGKEVVSIEHDKKPIDSAKALGIKEKIVWVEGDIVDAELVERTVVDYNVSEIYHLAALPIVKTGLKMPLPLYKTNIIGTLNVLEAAAKVGAKVLYLSTDKVYGYAGETAFRETDLLRPLSHYETSKACADLICQSYAYSLGLDVVVARSCNIYGPADFNDRLIPNTIRYCLEGRKPKIWRNINYVREFIYVDDLCNALLFLMKNVDGDVVNVGTGELKTQQEVVELILKHFPGLEAEVVDAPPYTSKEIQYQHLDHSKIEKLGWTPKIPFEEGIGLTVDWWVNK